MTKAVIDPCAAWTILDHYMRRSADLELDRVRGLLFGQTVNQTVQVRTVLQSMDGSFVENYLKTSPCGLCVGWYTTMPVPQDVQATDQLRLNVDNPLYVVVDLPTKERPQAKVQFRAFMLTKATLTTSLEDAKFVFYEIPCSVEPLDAATAVAVDTMAHLRFPEIAAHSDPSAVSSVSDASDVHAELRNMKKNLTAAIAYCDGVLAGKQVPDKQVGRALARVFAAQRTASEVPTEAVDEKLEDALMVLYISQVLEKQVQELQRNMARRDAAAAAAATAARERKLAADSAAAAEAAAPDASA